MTDGKETQVLEFSLGEANYCVDIQYVAEIVDGGSMSPLPSSEGYIEGVMDLRGETTKVVNPTKILETDGMRSEEMVTDGGKVTNRIVVLDQENIGSGGVVSWIVSAVHRVTRVSDDEVEDAPVSDINAIQGVIENDGEFTMWIEPEEIAT